MPTTAHGQDSTSITARNSAYDPVVVTGIGVVSPLGVGAIPVWDRLTAGKSGIRQLPNTVTSDVEAKIAGVVPDIAEDVHGFDIDAAAPAKERKKMDRFIILGLDAARQAIEQSGWTPKTDDERARTATIIASGIGGFPSIVNAVRTVDSRGAKKLSPFTVPSFLVNLAAGQVSIQHGFTGPMGAPVTACAASVQAIGDGLRMIKSGEADVAVCGGAEACIDRVSLGAFAAARALSTGFNDTPEKASRPFDTARDGFVMGEGAAVLVLETLSHARRRGAKPLAILRGYGTSADAYHITAAPEDGAGAQRAMRLALAMAGLSPVDIGYINAHATSTPVGDRGEIAAIKAVFGQEPDVAISSTKSATGHLLGAAGALEAAFTIMALQSGIAPPTLNLEEPDEMAKGLNLVGPQAQHKSMRYALSNGFGFGGVNASVIFERYDTEHTL